MNTYKAFYARKTIEIEAETSLQARDKAAAIFKARKKYDVTVVLLKVGDRVVEHSTSEI